MQKKVFGLFKRALIDKQLLILNKIYKASPIRLSAHSRYSMSI